LADEEDYLMIDKILEGYIKGFSEEYGMEGISKDLIFESFANYCVVSRLYPGSFDLDNICVDDGEQLGLDGIAIIVNDHLVTSKEEVDGVVKFLGRLNAQFIFTQAKTSGKFDMGEMSKFFTAVEEFFKQSSFVKFSEKAENLREIQQYIYDQSIKMESPPICELYYVTTGEWTDDKNLTGLTKSVIDRLKKTNSFSNVIFTPVDLEKIKHYYRSLKNKIVREVDFERNIVLPKIDGIQESFIGILPCKEYLKLITDDDDNLQKNLFYDNVRDFQGNNPVNKEIDQTLKGDPKFRDKFVVLNNGITIVAKSIGKVSSTFKLIDYQIVNGCQTSHILFNNRDKISSNVFLPIKLIVSTNSDVINAVIKATNRQTVVNVEAFESLRDFHKELEAFYDSINEEHRLYYERRSKQYDNDPKIKKNRIISLATQITCFISMFLMEPHSTHRYYGELLKVYREDKKDLFMDDHELYPYYISGYSLHLLDKLFNTARIPAKYKKFKFQMIMLLKIKMCGSAMHRFNDKKKVNTLCESVLWDKNIVLKEFQNTIEIIERALVTTNLSPHEAIRRKNFTVELISLASENVKAKEGRERGIVKWFDEDRGFGFIQNEKGKDFFVHYSAIWGTGYKSLAENQVVEFTSATSEKGLQAKDVEIVHA